MIDMDIISSWVWDPRQPTFFGKNKKSDRPLYHEVRCGNKESCGLYAKGMCALLNVGALEARAFCPYGSRTCESGPTQQAKSFYDWISERREKSVDTGIKEASERLAVVGEYVYMPYSYLSSGFCKAEEIPFEGKFLKLSALENSLGPIFAHKPIPLFGYQEIPDYKQKVLPALASHIREEMPHLIESHPFISKYIPATNVGREAYVSSLRHGTVVRLKDFDWTWDGEYLVSYTFTTVFFPVKGQAITKIKPEDNFAVKITKDSQVDANTKFKN